MKLRQWLKVGLILIFLFDNTYFWEDRLLLGQSWNCQKLKKLKVKVGKVEFVRSWKNEKLKIAWVENVKVEKFQGWKCKCWICEKLKIQKLKRQSWKFKVENAEVEPSRSPNLCIGIYLSLKKKWMISCNLHFFFDVNLRVKYQNRSTNKIIDIPRISCQN